jgi:hypothetical protein
LVRPPVVSAGDPRTQLTSRKWVRSVATTSAPAPASASSADAEDVARATRGIPIGNGNGEENSSPSLTTAMALPATALQLGEVAQERRQDDKQAVGHNLPPTNRKVLRGGPPPAPCGPPRGTGGGDARRSAKGSLTWRREQPPPPPRQPQPSARQETTNETDAAEGPAGTAPACASNGSAIALGHDPSVGPAASVPSHDRPSETEDGITAVSSPTIAGSGVANAPPNDGRASEQSQAQREALASGDRLSTSRDPVVPGGAAAANLEGARELPAKDRRVLTSSGREGAASNLVRVGHHKLERLDKRNAAAQAESLPRMGGVAVTTKASTPLPFSSSHQPPSRTYRKRETMQSPSSSKQGSGKRIKLGSDVAKSAPSGPLPSAAEGTGNSGKTYTDYCYRSSSQSRHRKLVKVSVDASTTPVCPHFARGVSCLDPKCRLRHDVSLEASRPFCRYFQHRGQCLREDCPFRHVKVNPNATRCPTFDLLGYCDDPRCALMHLAGSSSAAKNAAPAPAGPMATRSSATSYRRPPRSVENR